ncbi:receptor-like protein EIX2 [Bidens hawaiensis]|uniref:receptor-like protein EIX2 n=1 Tax=Bidens hawaiensis TaxID=980011 RepID=UPI004049822C
MGSPHWGLGIRLVSYLFLVMMTNKCVGDGNLSTTSCPEKERLALIKFKHSVEDATGMLSSWGIGSDCCRWERVGCDIVTGRVVSLHLRANSSDDYVFADNNDWPDGHVVVVGIFDRYQLVGNEVNPCLADLENLKHLDLSGNYFQYNPIPKFIGSLKQLRYLSLSYAHFSGCIPHHIGNLSNLKVLDLSSWSYLKTDDMAWISGLSKLEHLDLSGVDLSGTKNLHNLLYAIPSLLKLSLSRCGFSLAHLVSHHLNSSKELVIINHQDISENNFRGQLPSFVLNMTSLVSLDLSNNHFSMPWSFKRFIDMMPSLLELRLSGCKLRKINLSPHNLNYSIHSNIQHLDLSLNEIDGRLPSVLTNMSSLLSLDLSANRLSSSIPVIPNLLKLDISRNKFQQIEDVRIWEQCYLKELIVSDNELVGEMISSSTNVSKCSQNELEILQLDSNMLNSSIPESLGIFSNLRGLYLSFNKLTGPIPEALGNLRSLQELQLSSNQLIGPVPKFHGQLTLLNLADNQLNGSMPESLGKLKALTMLYLESNQLIGSIPESLGGLTSLRVLSLSSNLLKGTIPKSIGQLTKLYYLDISNNSLQGVVSEGHFANLSMLKYLNADYNNKLHFNISPEWIPPFQLQVARLRSCKIEDGFPQWFRTQKKLVELVMSNASIYGPLPTWLRLMPIISLLDLSYNKLTGSLTNLPIYEVRYDLVGMLLLQNNIFTGFIPRWLCTRTDLRVLDLSRNNLTGKIPKCLRNLPLSAMLLGSNRLTGGISSALGNPSLEWLQLNDNNFNEELPQDGRSLTSLIVMDLGENKFTGSIPEWIGENITMLSALRLHKNDFTGKIPLSLCKSQNLQILDLGHNNLTGSIPHCFGELDGMKSSYYYDNPISVFSQGNMMQVLKGATLDYTKNLAFVINMDLSSNKLVGRIPEALTKLEALIGLNLSSNNFSGSIPKDIGDMKSLFSLDLSANELSGVIPQSMAALNFLSHLNLSHNNLSGQIPTGNQLRTLTDPSIYADNTYLCGAPLPKECYPREKPPPTTSKKKDENANEPNRLWFYLNIACGFATGFWGIIGVLVLKKEWRHKLFMFCEVAMDKIYVAVNVRILKLKRRRGREAA